MLTTKTGADVSMYVNEQTGAGRRKWFLGVAVGAAGIGIGLAAALGFSGSVPKRTATGPTPTWAAASAPVSSSANRWVSSATIPTPDGHRATAHGGRSGAAPVMPTVTNGSPRSVAASQSWAPRVAAALGSAFKPSKSFSTAGEGGPTVTTAEFGDAAGTTVSVSTQQLQVPVPLVALTFGSSAASEKTLPDGTVVVVDPRGLPYSAAVYVVNLKGTMLTVTASGEIATGKTMDVMVGQLESLASNLVP